MARYLVTGATGFLGCHLVPLLREQGHDVVAFARGDMESLRAQGAIVRRGDVLDRAAVADAVAGCEGVFHCAGFVSRKQDDAEALRAVHVDGTAIVVEEARRAAVRRLVLASTSGIVAVSEDPSHVATEDDPAPYAVLSRFPYYRAKLYAERRALDANGDGLEVVAINPSLLLGPGDVRGSSVEDVRMFLEGKFLAAPAGGISYVDARDAALAMSLAMTRGTPGNRYLIGACNITVRAFFERLERVSGVKAPALSLPKGTRFARFAGELMTRAKNRFGVDAGVDPETLELGALYWYLDSAKAERELGWKPRDPTETLHDTVSDLRERGVVWPAEGQGA